MEMVKGFFSALAELLEKLAGDNDALKGVIDTIKKIVSALTGKTEETPEAGE